MEAQSPTGIDPKRPSREWRATIAFLVGALWSGGVWLALLAAPYETPAVERAAQLAIAALVPIALLIAGLAIRARRRWAVAALPLLLSAVAITDLVWAAAGLVEGRLTSRSGSCWRSGPSRPRPSRKVLAN